MIYVGTVLGLVICGSFALNLTARAAYETASYDVVESDGAFEIREYPDLMLASTAMRKESQGNDGSFMRLFRYISGANETEQKVAMTTPVFMEQTGTGTEGRMGFVIPKEVVANGAPKPAAVDVNLRKRDGGRFAVIRFSGRMDSADLKKAEERLRKWIADKQLVADIESESAGYDPPWTPGMFRRNEVLIRLKNEQESLGAKVE
jgi:DNA gyrase inhibitor GyrI